MRYKIIKNPEVAPKLTLADAKHFGIDITKDENKGVLKTVGPWQLPKSYKALAISKKYNTKLPYTTVDEITIYGQRTLTKLKSGGYEQEGAINLNGKYHTGFTSKQLFDVEGKLIDVAVIHIRVK